MSYHDRGVIVRCCKDSKLFIRRNESHILTPELKRPNYSSLGLSSSFFLLKYVRIKAFVEQLLREGEWAYCF